mmetsp:Transcript_17230/g.32616  ORF Transcript_17230/g.32616 Transcript_17230/m.32616 type:complete len:211 (+) Transcript_17230:876-1508(+)
MAQVLRSVFLILKLTVVDPSLLSMTFLTLSSPNMRRSRSEENPFLCTIESFLEVGSSLDIKNSRLSLASGTPEKKGLSWIFFVFTSRDSWSGFSFNKSARPMRSSNFEYPRWAMMFLTSSPTKWKKFTTCSGVPGNFLRSSSFWEVTPTGHVLRWQTRAITQPSAIIAIVPNPNSSAPIIAAMAISRPVRIPPSTRISTRLRNPLFMRAE